MFLSKEQREERAKKAKQQLEEIKVLQQQKEQNRTKLEALLNDSNAKDRDIEILKKRVMIETNELNNLNGKIDSNSQNKEKQEKDLTVKRNNQDEYNMNVAKLQEQVSKYFKDIIALQTGQLLDDIKGNAQILSGISQIKYIVQAICVKLILTDPFVQQKNNKDILQFTQDNCYVCTFRIYPSTMFAEIKKAACEFWNKIDQKYILTDEFFNNLASYNDTIMNFFKTYTTLNPNSEAIVFLVSANQKLRDLHRLQMECITLDDKKKGKMGDNQEGGGGHFGGKQQKKTLDFTKIEKNLPGLEQYKDPTEAQVIAYLSRSNPEAPQNNIWVFIFCSLMFVLTWISLELKITPREVYNLTKITESFMRTDDVYNQFYLASNDDATVFYQTEIKNREQLYDYLITDFAALMFNNISTETTSVNTSYVSNGKTLYQLVNTSTTVQYDSIIKEYLTIVGRIRIHTIFTNENVDCEGPSIIKCYETDVSSSTINTTSRGTSEFQTYRTAKEVNESFSIDGDFITMTGDGFTLDIDPNITAQEFITMMVANKDAIQSDASRGLIILFTGYSIRSDWWLSNHMFYEYGINEQVYLSQIRSQPFKPNYYETTDEKRHFLVDLIRIGVTLAVVVALIGVKVFLQIRRKEKLTQVLASNYLIGVIIFIVFVIQAAMCFSLQKSTIELLNADYYIDSYKLAQTAYYMIYFESLTLLILGLVIIKFTRISRRLSQLYNMIERPIILLLILFGILTISYILLAFAAHQLWGTYFYEFRKLDVSIYTLFTVFTLHQQEIFPEISKLYLFNEWWTFFLIVIYIVFLQYIFMNIFTAIFFEEQRTISVYEDSVYHKFPHLRRQKIGKRWLRGFFIFCESCIKRRQASMGNGAKEQQEDFSAVNNLKDKMREAKEKRKKNKKR